MATLTTIWWRDIPAQVIAKDRRQAHKVVLHPRFQVAIDRAAMKAGKKTANDYIEEWRRDARECGASHVAEPGELDEQLLPNGVEPEACLELRRRLGVGAEIGCSARAVELRAPPLEAEQRLDCGRPRSGGRRDARVERIGGVEAALELCAELVEPRAREHPLAGALEAAYVIGQPP
jgi:hypothetical protein